MSSRITMGVAVAALALVAPLEAQDRGEFYDFRFWRIEADSSRRSALTFCGGGSASMDLRVWVKPLRFGLRPARSATPYRLDADFAVHVLSDSTLLIADVTAGRIISPGSAPSPDDSVVRARVDEETYRRSLVVRSGQTAWFYPFGVPRRGEQGLAVEIARRVDGCPVRADRVLPAGGHDEAPSVAQFGVYGVEVRERLHRARVRLESGTSASGWRSVFEGEVLTRIPVRVSLGALGARGQDLVFELEAPEWGMPPDLQESLCWRWYWADRQPPGGSSCGSVAGGTTVQRLYGSRAGAGHLRVTILAAS